MKINLIVRISLIFVLTGILFGLFQINIANAQVGNICAQHINREWAWTKQAAWMSTNKTGDWKTDNWFYMLKPGEAVIVTQTDAKLGYYLVCYDFGSDTGWQPIVGWVQEDRILLQSSITPAP